MPETARDPRVYFAAERLLEQTRRKLYQILAEDPSGEPDDQPNQPESRQVPLPSVAASDAPTGGPWGSATDPAGTPQGAPDAPWGNHPAGPWGRH